MPPDTDQNGASPPLPPIALSMGDPAGVGPDILLQAWADREPYALPPFIVAGDVGLLQERARILGLDVPIERVDTPEAAYKVFAGALPVYPVELPVRSAPGAPDAASATAIIEAIDVCVDWAQNGKACAIVTSPINKRLLYDAGFKHPGHTEYLAELCTTRARPPHPVMMLACGELRVVPVTVHIPLAEIPGALTQPLITETVEITARELCHSFGVSNPRIAVTGLNPHAGEDGTLGREEIEIIAPSIAALKAKGIDVTGPHPADAIFQERTRTQYDAVVAMYHDQALIPVKTLAFDAAVNVTLGLPIIRTSPDHGTAYELAGSGNANPGSLIESIKLAASIALHRAAAA